MYTIFSLLVFGTSLASCYPGNHHKPSFNWRDTEFFLAFGDSYTYVQGTAGLQNYSFIGDLQNYSYTPHELFTNEIVQNQIGTSAGGPNWVEYLTGCFFGLPSKCRTQLWDFAFAGSDVSTIYTQLHHNYTVSLVNQIVQWSTYAQPIIPVDLSNALVAIWIGINDIGDSDQYKFPLDNATDFPSFYKEIIGTIFEATETILNAGYRSYLIMNLPPLELTPGNLARITPLPNSTMVHEWNSILAATASQFSASHPGTKVMVFDSYTFLSNILNSPGLYGITNTTAYCPEYDAPDIATNYAAYGCLPLEEYFWYNNGHITWKVHEFLADAVSDFLHGESA